MSEKKYNKNRWKAGIEGNFDNKPQWNVKSPNKKEVKLNFFVKIVNWKKRKILYNKKRWKEELNHCGETLNINLNFPL